MYLDFKHHSHIFDFLPRLCRFKYRQYISTLPHVFLISLELNTIGGERSLSSDWPCISDVSKFDGGRNGIVLCPEFNTLATARHLSSGRPCIPSIDISEGGGKGVSLCPELNMRRIDGRSKKSDAVAFTAKQNWLVLFLFWYWLMLNGKHNTWNLHLIEGAPVLTPKLNSFFFSEAGDFDFFCRSFYIQLCRTEQRHVANFLYYRVHCFCRTFCKKWSSESYYKYY